MERTGEVTAVQGEWLEVTFCRPADCEKCNACHGGQKTTVLRIKGEGKVGDYAVVSMPENTVYKASIVAYAIPAAGLIIGMLAGEALYPSGNSLGGVIGGLIGLALPAAAIVLTEKKRQQSKKYEPELIRVISSKE